MCKDPAMAVPHRVVVLALDSVVAFELGLPHRFLAANSIDPAWTGSGPYTLVSAVPGDHYTFQVRKNYAWGPGGSTTATNGLPAKVTMKVVTNETTRPQAALAEEIRSLGVDLADEELQTTATAAAHALRGKRVLALTMQALIPLAIDEHFTREQADTPRGHDSAPPNAPRNASCPHHSQS